MVFLPLVDLWVNTHLAAENRRDFGFVHCMSQSDVLPPCTRHRKFFIPKCPKSVASLQNKRWGWLCSLAVEDRCFAWSVKYQQSRVVVCISWWSEFAVQVNRCCKRWRKAMIMVMIIMVIMAKMKLLLNIWCSWSCWCLHYSWSYLSHSKSTFQFVLRLLSCPSPCQGWSKKVHHWRLAEIGAEVAGGNSHLVQRWLGTAPKPDVWLLWKRGGKHIHLNYQRHPKTRRRQGFTWLLNHLPHVNWEAPGP